MYIHGCFAIWQNSESEEWQMTIRFGGLSVCLLQSMTSTPLAHPFTNITHTRNRSICVCAREHTHTHTHTHAHTHTCIHAQLHTTYSPKLCWNLYRNIYIYIHVGYVCWSVRACMHEWNKIHSYIIIYTPWALGVLKNFRAKFPTFLYKNFHLNFLIIFFFFVMSSRWSALCLKCNNSCQIYWEDVSMGCPPPQILEGTVPCCPP